MRTTALIAGVLFLATLPTVAPGGDFAIETSLKRDDLRNEYRKLTRELTRVEGEIAQDENTSTTITGRATVIWAVRDAQRERMRRLADRRRELRTRRDTLERAFDQLTARVRAHYGEVPVWWGNLE